MSDSEENKNDWKSKELGALWARRGKNQNYFSGYVTVGDLGFEKRIKIVGFKNNFKDSENQPDFRLYESEEKEVSNTNKTQPQVEGEDQEII